MPPRRLARPPQQGSLATCSKNRSGPSSQPGPVGRALRPGDEAHGASNAYTRWRGHGGEDRVEGSGAPLLPPAPTGEALSCDGEGDVELGLHPGLPRHGANRPSCRHNSAEDEGFGVDSGRSGLSYSTTHGAGPKRVQSHGKPRRWQRLASRRRSSGPGPCRRGIGSRPRGRAAEASPRGSQKARARAKRKEEAKGRRATTRTRQRGDK